MHASECLFVCDSISVCVCYIVFLLHKSLPVIDDKIVFSLHKWLSVIDDKIKSIKDIQNIFETLFFSLGPVEPIN